MIINSKPTGGLSETDIHCMAIAVHLKISSGMDYAYVSYGENPMDPQKTWENYLAYLEVKDTPKFSLTPEIAGSRRNASNSDDQVGAFIGNNYNDVDIGVDSNEINEDVNKENDKFLVTPNLNKTIRSDV